MLTLPNTKSGTETLVMAPATLTKTVTIFKILMTFLHGVT